MKRNTSFEMKNPLISIIVPVYNVERYLGNCIQSILSQTFQKIEIILVDDGSPDNSGFLCDKLRKEDNRIKVIHQKNQGVTAARAAGVRIASAEWICFVDSDDELPQNSLELLLNNVKEDIDIVVGSVQFIGDHKWPYKKMNRKMTGLDLIKQLLIGKIHGGPYARLIRKTLFDAQTLNIPRSIVCGEDWLMNIRLAQKASAVQIIPDTVYSYIERSNSATSQNPFANKNYISFFERILLESIFKENQKKLKYYIFYDRLYRRYCIAKRLVKLKIKALLSCQLI